MMLRGHRGASLGDDRRGAAYVEFLIAFLPLWTFFLCVFQLALVVQADLVVRHAADAAARSAAVVLPDDPAEYGGEPEGSVARGRVTLSPQIEAMLERSWSSAQSFPPSVLEGLQARGVGDLGRSRLNTIRTAAHAVLLPLIPSGAGIRPTPTVENALGGPGSLGTSLAYQTFSVAVTFPDATDDVVSTAESRVRVAFAFPCVVPIARRIVCSSFERLLRRPEWARAFLTFPQELARGYVRPIEHEVSFLLQDAPYAYKVRGS